MKKLILATLMMGMTSVAMAEKTFTTVVKEDNKVLFGSSSTGMAHSIDHHMKIKIAHACGGAENVVRLLHYTYSVDLNVNHFAPVEGENLNVDTESDQPLAFSFSYPTAQAVATVVCKK